MADDRCGNCYECIRYQNQLDATDEAAHKPTPSDTKSTGSTPAEDVDLQCARTKTTREPLAWSLDPSNIQPQNNCRLFTSLPLELREIIYTYTLKDTASYPIDSLGPKDPIPVVHVKYLGHGQNAGSLAGGKPLHPSDITFSLLLACKAVYRETWGMPLKVNAYRMGASRNLSSARMSAWQLAQIRGLDITIKQRELENGKLEDVLKEMGGDVRHQGAYVVPMRCFRDGEWARIEGCSRTLDDNVLVPAIVELPDTQPQRLDDILNRLPTPAESILPSSRALHITLAQPLTHLTLRLTRTDWSTWNVAVNLHLDPSFGRYDLNEGRPSGKAMRLRAEQRKAGRHPRLNPQSWGAHVVSALPDLKTLELVLETFEARKEELERVVQYAKMWRFGFGGDGEEEGEGKEWALVWDGDVVERRWKRDLGETVVSRRDRRLLRPGPSCNDCNDFEVRTLRYVRTRVVE
ncbi:hypothetical protein J4E81_007791 [Alternaria sp. BMP 2799]|nr:hypothetical protein J4E81_007791 [Alternaria sp. BMP 2799]